jgi:GxGYxYP putative glycoside hydrolase C-terminal domain
MPADLVMQRVLDGAGDEFLITDGDNIQWMLGDFQSDPRWFASPHRGSLSLGWGISPTLLDLALSVMRWYYDNAGSDWFMVGPSGGGYLYPSRYPGADLAPHTARLPDAMDRADLGVVQIIDFDSFDDTRLWSTYLRRPAIEGLIYLEYSRYGHPQGAGRLRRPQAGDLRAYDALGRVAGRRRRERHGRAERGGPGPALGGRVLGGDVARVEQVGGQRQGGDRQPRAPHVQVVAPDVLVRMVARNVEH